MFKLKIFLFIFEENRGPNRAVDRAVPIGSVEKNKHDRIIITQPQYL